MPNALSAGAAFPTTTLPLLGGGDVTLGGTRDAWQLIIIYRGLHCPLCKTFLTKLDGLAGEFAGLGCEIVTVSADPETKAQALKDELDIGLSIAYDLSVDQMKTLGLYISEPRSKEETDRPFAEPGTFLLTPEGHIQIVDVSNAPFARPDPETMLMGLKMATEKDYPVRGTLAA